MEKDAATQDPQVLDEQGATPPPAQDGEQGATQTTTPSPAVAGEALKKLEERLKELETRQPSEVDADAIAERIRQTPAFKQSLKALTQNAVRAEMEAEIEKRTQAIDELEADGTLDADAAEKKRRAITKAIKEEFAKRPPPEDYPPQPMSQGAPPINVQERNKQIAAVYLQRRGLAWSDVPELENGMKLPPNQAEFEALVDERAIDKRAQAKLQSAVQAELKKLAGKSNEVKAAEESGALAPPPAGATSPKRTIEIVNAELMKLMATSPRTQAERQAREQKRAKLVEELTKLGG